MRSCDLKPVLLYDMYCQGDRKVEYSITNDRTAQVGRDLERSFGPAFRRKGSLDEMLSRGLNWFTVSSLGH